MGHKMHARSVSSEGGVLPQAHVQPQIARLSAVEMMLGDMVTYIVLRLAKDNS